MRLEGNCEKLNEILCLVHNLTGITVGILDLNLNFIARYPEGKNPFCAYVQTSPTGLSRCTESDTHLLKLCVEQKCPVSHTCHAGLRDTAFPIFRSGIAVGYMIFGQVLENGKKQVSFHVVQNNLKELGLDTARLKTYYRELSFISQDKIDSASQLIQMLLKYIWSEQLITQKNDTPFEDALKIIDEHLTEEINVADLCQQVGTCKNVLYKQFNTHLGCSIKAYINQQRILRAEQLLKTTDYPISAIATMVGMSNDNYFCRAFKAQIHQTPMQYRKKRGQEDPQNEKECVNRETNRN